MTARDLDETTKSELKREIRGRPGVERFLVKSSNTDELFRALQKFCAFTNPVNDALSNQQRAG
jgi:hypothetical protein